MCLRGWAVPGRRDSMRPGPEGKENLLVHKACFDLGITHIESLCNLETLLGAGPSRVHAAFKAKGTSLPTL